MQVIYLIDDDETSHVYHKIMCQSAGYKEEQILSFNSADKAILQLKELLNSGTPNLWPSHILLDINMPVKTGFDFLEEVTPMLVQHPTPPEIYMVSSSSNPSDVSRAKSYDLVKDFVTKFATVQFFKKIKES